jgi:hypothetical protein
MILDALPGACDEGLRPSPPLLVKSPFGQGSGALGDPLLKLTHRSGRGYLHSGSLTPRGEGSPTIGQPHPDRVSGQILE